jgi:hypothetical protein
LEARAGRNTLNESNLLKATAGNEVQSHVLGLCSISSTVFDVSWRSAACSTGGSMKNRCCIKAKEVAILSECVRRDRCLVHKVARLQIIHFRQETAVVFLYDSVPRGCRFSETTSFKLKLWDWFRPTNFCTYYSL